MLTSKEIVDKFIDEFIEEYDGRSNKFFNKVKTNKELYIKIVDLYFETKSANKVSEQVKIDSKYITTILNKFGISTAKRKMDEETISLIVEDKLKGMSLGDLKRKYNFSLATIKRNLNNRGIDTSIENPINKLSEKVLEDYKTKQLSEIAKEYKVGKETVKKYLIKNGVKLRTLSQSVSLNVKNKGVNFKGVNILYYSVKNSCDILANSSYELSRFIELESDDTVKEYTKDVETLCYNDCKNNYTADILVLYNDGRKIVEEVKPNWYLKYMKKVVDLHKIVEPEDIAKDLNISVKSVKKFLLSDLKFKEAFSYFRTKQIDYKIITEDQIDIKLGQKYLSKIK